MSLWPIPNLPDSIDIKDWATFQSRYDRLRERPLDGANLLDWLREWSELNKIVEEVGSAIYIDKTLDTADPAKQDAFLRYVESIAPGYAVADQALRERLLAQTADDNALGPDMRVAVQTMRNQAGLFRDANVPLLTDLSKLGNEYDKVTGGLKAEWEGETANLSQLQQHLHNPDRAIRERAWRTSMALWQGVRDELNDLYGRMIAVRQQVARNADLPDFRAYSFRARNRFDYTPDDCLTFHEAIEAVVVPAAERVYARQKARLGVDRLRPWDVEVDAHSAVPLRPYAGQDALIGGSLKIFERVEPEFARHIALMAEEGLLDLDTRPSKRLGAYCSALTVRERPFIFMNGVGLHDDVQTMLHESGHAFHAFAAFKLPYIWQTDVPLEFCEVASMGMELLAAPYLTKSEGGFYTESEAARARSEHLSGILTFLPYMAVVDAFQHWVYTHPEAAQDAAACDATWDSLWARFMHGVDWSGFESERTSGWHRKLHIFLAPFYYIEYGMAQVGALQVWRNARRDQAAAVQAYRSALALGGTCNLPELYAAAGAEFRFDTPMLTDLVAMVEETLEELEQQI